MRRAEPDELKTRTRPLLTAHLSEEELHEWLPVPFEDVGDPYAAPEPSKGALIALDSGHYVVVHYGLTSGQMIVEAAENSPELLKAFFEEVPLPKARVLWQRGGMTLAELVQGNIELVDRLINHVCRRARLFGADAEDFASSVKIALIKNDYAILRSYRGQSSLATFLTIVIRRLLADERIQAYGRWRPSMAARQMGETAVLLEMLLVHDHRSLDDALPILRAQDGEVTRESLEAMAARLPKRAQRTRAAELNGTPSETAPGRESRAENAGEDAGSSTDSNPAWIRVTNEDELIRLVDEVFDAVHAS